MKKIIVSAVAGFAMLGLGGVASAEPVQLSEVQMDGVSAGGWYKFLLPLNLAGAEADASAVGAVTLTYSDTYTAAGNGVSYSSSNSFSGACCSGYAPQRSKKSRRRR